MGLVVEEGLEGEGVEVVEALGVEVVADLRGGGEVLVAVVEEAAVGFSKVEEEVVVHLGGLHRVNMGQGDSMDRGRMGS